MRYLLRCRGQTPRKVRGFENLRKRPPNGSHELNGTRVAKLSSVGLRGFDCWRITSWSDWRREKRGCCLCELPSAVPGNTNPHLRVLGRCIAGPGRIACLLTFRPAARGASIAGILQCPCSQIDERPSRVTLTPRGRWWNWYTQTRAPASEPEKRHAGSSPALPTSTQPAPAPQTQSTRPRNPTRRSQ